jgi:hypothetical protein
MSYPHCFHLIVRIFIVYIYIELIGALGTTASTAQNSMNAVVASNLAINLVMSGSLS